MEFEPLRLQSEIQPKFPKEKYAEMVEKAKHYIREGDIFQVVLSNPMRAKATGSLFDTYRVLRASNPSPYMFYFSSDDIELAGASPETLAKLENGTLSTFPLAGTRPRGKTREEDKELEEGLLKDEKELAEHNMLVDLGRNDIGKISKIGTVKVEKYLCVERFSHVMHLGSTVTGIIRDDKDAVDAVDTQIQSLPDHRGTGTEQTRNLRRRHRISGFCRKSGYLHCHPPGLQEKRRNLYPFRCRNRGR